MKRSQINTAIDNAHRALSEHGVRLPPTPTGPRRLAQGRTDYARVTRNGLGWAVTDFGQGNFDQVGITMFDVRNGNVERPEEGTPYGEKISCCSRASGCRSISTGEDGRHHQLPRRHA